VSKILYMPYADYEIHIYHEDDKELNLHLFSPLLHNEHSAKDVKVALDLQAPTTKTKTPLLNT
jgi:hypothetical protein